MRSPKTIIIAVTLALALVGTTGAGIRRAAHPMWWGSGEVVTLEGTITEVDRPFATLESDGETYAVHLGPIWYWESRGYALNPGDRVAIKGHAWKDGGATHVFPQTLTRSGETYTLADEDGVPQWRGPHGRGPRTEAWRGAGAHRYGWGQGRGYRHAGRCGCPRGAR